MYLKHGNQTRDRETQARVARFEGKRAKR